MQILLSVVFVSGGVTCLVCWIITVYKAFSNGDVWLGVLLIFCSPISYIVGWIKSSDWDNTNVMIIWSVGAIMAILARTVIEV